MYNGDTNAFLCSLARHLRVRAFFGGSGLVTYVPLAVNSGNNYYPYKSLFPSLIKNESQESYGDSWLYGSGSGSETSINSIASSTPIHQRAAVLYMPMNAQGYDNAKINGNRWIVDSQSEYRGRASAVRRASTGRIGDIDYLSDDFGVFGIDFEGNASRFDNLGGGVFACNPANRVGIILCGEYSDDDPPVMRSKWVLSSVYVYGHSISGSTASVLVSVSDPFIPSGLLLSSESRDESTSETSRLCIYDGLRNSYASDLLYNSPHGDVLTAAIATRDGRQSPVAAAAYTHIFGPSFATPNDFIWVKGLAPIIPSPTWSSFVGEYFSANLTSPYTISAITMHLHSSDITQYAAARKDSAVIFPRYIQTGYATDQAASSSAFSSASGGCYDAGDFDCLLLDEKPFDYAEKQRISCYSDSMFRTNANGILSQDAGFQRPEDFALNSENVIGVDPSERLPNNTTKTFLKVDESEFGTLSDEPVCAVALRSYAIHNQFDVQDGTTPYSDGKFRFQGKVIKQTGVEFVPWSSNSFSEPKTSYSAVQGSSPTPPATVSTSYVSYCLKSTRAEQESDLSGKWYTEESVYDLTDAGTPSDLYFEVRYISNNDIQNPLPTSVWPQNFIRTTQRTRIYSGTRTSFPRRYGDGDFFPTKQYQPNVSFDEDSWLAAQICEYIHRYGVTKGDADWYISRTGQFDYSVPPNRFNGRRESAFLSRHLLANAASRSIPFSPPFYPIDATNGSQSLLPSLAGKEFLCGKDSVRGKELSDCLFHCLEAGRSFSKTIVREFIGARETHSASISSATFRSAGDGYRVDQTVVSSPYAGSFSHECTFNTDRVEVYVQWSASLQCPGEYRAGRNLPKMITKQNIEDPPSVIAPMLFVKESEYDDATPILVAQLWVRANGTVSVSTTPDLPEAFGLSGVHDYYKARVFRADAGSSSDVVNLSAARLGDNDFFCTEDSTIPPSFVGMRYLGAFPFNRAQTQQLLDGQTVTPTHWYMKEEGSDFESQPVCVPWHNYTFGTYKLKFRLVTE